MNRKLIDRIKEVGKECNKLPWWMQRLMGRVDEDKVMSELIPCPSCGKDQNVVTRSDGYIVWCVICRVEMPINLWNHRPIEDALNKRIKELCNLLMMAKNYTTGKLHDEIKAALKGGK